MAAPGTTVEEREAQWRQDVLKQLEAQSVFLAQLVELVGRIEVPAVAEAPAKPAKRGR